MLNENKIPMCNFGPPIFNLLNVTVAADDIKYDPISHLEMGVS